MVKPLTASTSHNYCSTIQVSDFVSGRTVHEFYFDDWKSVSDIIKLVLENMDDEDNPNIPSTWGAEKVPTAADKLNKHQEEYEKRVPADDKRNEVEEHNKNYPKLQETLDKKRSILKVTDSKMYNSRRLKRSAVSEESLCPSCRKKIKSEIRKRKNRKQPLRKSDRRCKSRDARNRSTKNKSGQRQRAVQIYDSAECCRALKHNSKRAGEIIYKLFAKNVKPLYGYDDFFHDDDDNDEDDIIMVHPHNKYRYKNEDQMESREPSFSSFGSNLNLDQQPMV